MRKPFSLGMVLCLGFALVSLVQDAAAEITSPEKRIEEIERRLGGRMGVAALDTGSGRHFEHRAQERFAMCSTFKFLAVAAVLHQVDEKQEQLTRFIPYTKADLLEYAPITAKHVEEGGMTLDALCAAAIEYSDNTAANLLLTTIGGTKGFTRYARSLGDEKTRLDRMEPKLNSALPNDERDTTTPAAMVGDLRRVLLGDALAPASHAQLETWLMGNTTGRDLIRAAVPDDWQVGDKTGRGAHGSTNDIAILRPPGKAAILLAIYFSGSTAPSDVRAAAVAEAARAALDAFR